MRERVRRHLAAQRLLLTSGDGQIAQTAQPTTYLAPFSPCTSQNVAYICCCLLMPAAQSADRVRCLNLSLTVRRCLHACDDGRCLLKMV